MAQLMGGAMWGQWSEAWPSLRRMMMGGVADWLWRRRYIEVVEGGCGVGCSIGPWAEGGGHPFSKGESMWSEKVRGYPLLDYLVGLTYNASYWSKSE